uniref:Pyrin domain-containing protein n=1 Tax=Seriola lalandi dorsalis TaxID=1841481 RepID=A0A3B4WPX2_SERLL
MESSPQSSKQFKDFKWYLQQPDIMEGYHTITVSDLEKAERRDTVDLMVQTCGFHGALEVSRTVLQKINRNDLVQSLSDSSSATEGQSVILSLLFSVSE